MKKLISLIKFRNSIEERLKELPQGLAEFIDEKGILLKMIEVESFGSGYDEEVDKEIDNLQQMSAHMDNIVGNLNNLIQKINAEIDSIGNNLSTDAAFQEGFQDYSKWEPLLNFNKHLSDLIKIRAKQYCDWHYPGLLFHAKNKEFIDCMVASDPLYLISKDFDQLQLIVSDYPEIYQNRLRLYPYEHESTLPHGQFGFVLMWNYLEFCSLPVVKEQLKKILDLLRPGGVFMFSYSNGDLPETASLILKQRYNFCSFRAIMEFSKELGFEILTHVDGLNRDYEGNRISWCEIKKPGELSTVKAHQALGKIIPK